MVGVVEKEILSDRFTRARAIRVEQQQIPQKVRAAAGCDAMNEDGICQFDVRHGAGHSLCPRATDRVLSMLAELIASSSDSQRLASIVHAESVWPRGSREDSV